MIILYKYLGIILIPLIKLNVFFRIFQGKENRARFSERYGITSIERLKSTDYSLYEISLLLVQYLTDMISSLGRGTINVKV